MADFKRIDFGGLSDNIQSSTGKDEDYDKHNLKKQKADRYDQDTKHRKLLTYWVILVVSLWLLGVTKHRKLLTYWVILVVSLWLLGVLFVVTFNSYLQFNLHNSVLITLLATTTANILGLAYIILEGLFRERK